MAYSPVIDCHHRGDVLLNLRPLAWNRNKSHTHASLRETDHKPQRTQPERRPLVFVFIPWLGNEEEPSSLAGDEEEEAESGGGIMKAPCRLPLPAGNGRLTVGVGPQSTGGRMRAGRNQSKG